jgi:hypothetical protein
VTNHTQIINAICFRHLRGPLHFVAVRRKKSMAKSKRTEIRGDIATRIKNAAVRAGIVAAGVGRRATSAAAVTRTVAGARAATGTAPRGTCAGRAPKTAGPSPKTEGRDPRTRGADPATEKKKTDAIDEAAAESANVRCRKSARPRQCRSNRPSAGGPGHLWGCGRTRQWKS